VPPRCGTTTCGSGLWERAWPAKGRRRRPAGYQRLLSFRCPELRIGDAVQWWCLPGPLKPSMAAVSLALPGQTAPSRHHHCPAHWAAEPPRVSSPSQSKRPDLSAKLELCERAQPTKGSNAPGRIPETSIKAASKASLESCRPAKPAFRLQGKLPQT